ICQTPIKTLFPYTTLFRSDEKYKFTKNNKEYVVDGIKYQNITVILLEIVKKQQSKITQLENQINNILANNQELINTVNILKENMNLLLQNQNIQLQDRKSVV